MKRKVVMLLCVIFICLCFFGCDDEFGCLNMHGYWYIYLPKGITKAVYIKRDNSCTELRREEQDKEEFDLFFCRCGGDLKTRRNYKNESVFIIEYESRNTETINAKIEIPYLESNEYVDFEFAFNSKESKEPIKYVFTYYFYRTI